MVDGTEVCPGPKGFLPPPVSNLGEITTPAGASPRMGSAGDAPSTPRPSPDRLLGKGGSSPPHQGPRSAHPLERGARRDPGPSPLPFTEPQPFRMGVPLARWFKSENPRKQCLSVAGPVLLRIGLTVLPGALARQALPPPVTLMWLTGGFGFAAVGWLLFGFAWSTPRPSRAVGGSAN